MAAYFSYYNFCSLGGLIIGSAGMIRIYSLQRRVKQLEKEKREREEKNSSINKNFEAPTDSK